MAELLFLLNIFKKTTVSLHNSAFFFPPAGGTCRVVGFSFKHAVESTGVVSAYTEAPQQHCLPLTSSISVVYLLIINSLRI